jgi:hypothetical protein
VFSCCYLDAAVRAGGVLDAAVRAGGVVAADRMERTVGSRPGSFGT